MLRSIIISSDDVDVNAVDYLGKTALHIAAYNNDIERCRSLLQRGANPNAKEVYGNTVLHSGLRYGIDLDTCRLLIENGADVNTTNNSQESVLFSAIDMRKHDIAELLVQQGANVNVSNKIGATILHQAIIHSNDNNFLELLISTGADVNTSDESGYTPLHYALSFGKLSFVELLVYYGADVHAVNRNLETPLHIASRYALNAICKFLILCGAKVDVLDNAGFSPLSYYANNTDEVTDEITKMLDLSEYVNSLSTFFDNKEFGDFFENPQQNYLSRVGIYNKYCSNIGKKFASIKIFGDFLLQNNDLVGRTEYDTTKIPTYLPAVLDIPYECIKMELNIWTNGNGERFLSDMYYNLWRGIIVGGTSVENLDSGERVALYASSKYQVFSFKDIMSLILTYVGGDIAIYGANHLEDVVDDTDAYISSGDELTKILALYDAIVDRNTSDSSTQYNNNDSRVTLRNDNVNDLLNNMDLVNNIFGYLIPVDTILGNNIEYGEEETKECDMYTLGNSSEIE